MINWLEFLQSNRIDYIEFGKNVKRGNVNIDCPFCNLPESHHSSHHLGIDPESGLWGCWRDNSHRGRKPHKLIMKLINCSYMDVENMLQESNIVEPGKVVDFFNNPEEMFSMNDGKIIDNSYDKKVLDFYPEFRKLENKGVGKRFFDYLRFDRKFGDLTQYIIDEFNLHYAITGKMLTRVVFPYYDMDRKLLTWSGRTIIPNSMTKYKALSTDESIIKTTNTLFGIDNVLCKRDILIVTEGPIDVVKLAVVGRKFNISAVGLSTKVISEKQAEMLMELSSSSEKIIVILDRGEEFHSSKIVNQLSHIKNIESLPFPNFSRVHDFGDMREKQLIEFLSSLKR